MATCDVDQWTDLGLVRLFNPESIEHLPIDEQLLYYKKRNLIKTKVFNTAAKIWGAPSGRRRIIIAGGGVGNRSRCFQGTDFSLQDGGPTAANVDVGDEIGDEQNSKKCSKLKHEDQRDISTPSQMKNHSKVENLSQDKKTTPSSADETELKPGKENYQTWLTSRMKIRSDLESMGDMRKWFANKPNKSVLEKRVLQRVIEASKKEPEKPATADHDSERDSPTQSEPPDIEQPAPVGLVILDKWIHDNHLRLLELFAEMDKDKDWLVTLEDFKHIVDTAGIPMTDSELQDLIMALDSDADNHIKYQDIVRGHKNYRTEERSKQQSQQQLQEKKMESEIMDPENTNRKPPQYISRYNLANKAKTKKKKIIRTSRDRYPNEAVFLAEENSPYLIKSDIMTSSRNRKGLKTKTPVKEQSIGRTVVTTITENIGAPSTTATPLSSRERAKTSGDRSSVKFEPDAKFEEGHGFNSRPSTVDSLTIPMVDMSEKINLDDEILLESSRRHRFQKRVDKSGLEVESLMIRAGEPGIDEHCSYSTMSSENTDTIHTYRLQTLKEYLHIIDLCEQHNIIMDKKLLKRALLYPGDKPVSILKKNLRQPGADPFPSGVVPAAVTKVTGRQSRADIDSSRSALSSSAVTMQTTFRSGDESSPHARGSIGHETGHDVPSSLHYPTVEEDEDSESSVYTEDYTLKRPPHCQQSNPSFLYPKKLRPSMKPKIMRLTTGQARIAPKTDCWMTFSEYLTFSRDVKKKKPHYRGSSDADACWPGHLLDRLRLCMPPYQKTGENGNTAEREQSIFTNTKQPLPSIAGKYNNVKFYSESDAGYVKYGDITQNKIYQL